MKEYLPGKSEARKLSIHLFIFFLSIYMVSLSESNIISVDQYSWRYETTKSIVEGFDLSIPEGSGIRGADGRDFSPHGLGWSVLALPFYIIGDFVERGESFVGIMNPLVAAATATVVFLFSLALGYSKRASLGVSILYGLGTFAWPLSKHPFDHTEEAFFIVFSVYLMYRHLTGAGLGYLVGSAVSFGIALNIRLTSLLVLPALSLMMAGVCSIRRLRRCDVVRIAKRTAVFFATLLPFAGFVMWYNFYRFGSPFETGYQLVAAKTGLDFFSGTPLWTGLKGFLVSPGKGFFYYSPIAIFFPLAFVHFCRKHRGTAISFLVIILSYLLFLSRNIYWHGDWAWGPRYLLAITPFMMLPLAELLDSGSASKNCKTIIVSICLVFSLSVVIQIAAVSVNFYNHFFHLQQDENIKFIVNRGDGVPGICEPPPEVYFDWAQSPILAQLTYAKKIGTNLSDYRYVDLPHDASDLEKIRASPPMHMFDFWWVYLYYLRGDRAVFLLPILFLLEAGLCAHRMERLSRSSS